MKFPQKFDGPFNRILSTYRTHMSRGTNGEIQSQHFKLFLSFVLEGANPEYDDVIIYKLRANFFFDFSSSIL